MALFQLIERIISKGKGYFESEQKPGKRFV